MLALSGLIIAFAFFIQFLMGFGGGLVAVPLLGIYMPMADAVNLVMLFQLMTGIAIISIYKDVDWQTIKVLIPSSLIGIVIGVFGLKYINGDAIRIFLALFIILYLAKAHMGKDYIGQSVKKCGTHGAGLAGGFIAGLVGMGAPIYVVFFNENNVSGKTLRANMLVILFLTYLARLPLSAGAGLITPQLFKDFVLIIPAFLLAAFLGQKINTKINEHLFAKIMGVLLLASAISLLAKALI
ncbi:MAG: sulfite exporter TauE/SafE family protein [Bdellovibrionales bacterium]